MSTDNAESPMRRPVHRKVGDGYRAEPLPPPHQGYSHWRCPTSCGVDALTSSATRVESKVTCPACLAVEA